MSLFDFARLLYRNTATILLFSLALAFSAYFFTRNEPKQYVSEAVIYTGIASGFNIESGEDSRVDYHAINNAFDNLMSIIKSRVTMEEVALKLLATHLHQTTSDPTIICKEDFEQFNNSFPVELKQKVMDSTIDQTYRNLKAVFYAHNPYLNNLIHNSTGHYSIKSLKELSAKRSKSSDMVELAYISDDPAISKLTLEIVVEVFSDRYKAMKESETGDVVAYFEEEMKKVKGKLVDAENRLTNFRVKSRIINYVEQTKAIAFKKQNAMEDYAMKKMGLKATESALKQIEEKLSIRESIMTKNADIIDNRNRLAEVTSIIAYAKANQDTTESISSLEKEQQELKATISSDVEKLFGFSNSKEGIPSKQLLNDWLETLIQLNRETVNVELYAQHLDEIDAEYDHFSPMGSTISRLEREIDVFEREYLEVLHGMNMARLRQQNIEMASNLEVIDQPQIPSEPLSSKRKLIIIAAFIFGHISTISFLIAIEILDVTLKHPERAREITGLEITGALPVVNERLFKKHEGAFEKALGNLSGKIMLERDHRKNSDQTLILGISTTPSEGKTFALNHVFHELKEDGENVCFITPFVESAKSETHKFTYTINSQFPSVKNVSELTGHDLSSYSIILFEMPAWVDGKIPHNIIRQADLSLWLVRADRSWSVPNKMMLKDFQKFSTSNPLLILNGIKTYHLDQLIAEVPTKRSGLANWFRRITKLQLSTSGIKNLKS